MKIIKKIEKCPIRDSIVEIRFETDIPQNAVFGIIYNSIKSKYTKSEQLPINQLPAQVLENDPALKYKPRYKLLNSKGYSLQVGPNVLLISAKMPYEGWSVFKEEIYFILQNVMQTNLVEKVNRLGIRVINIFNGDVFENIKVHLSVISEDCELISTLIRTQIMKSGFINTIQIAKDARFQDDKSFVQGSMIDIDTSKEYTDDSFLNSFKKEIEDGHLIEKRIFFDLLKDDFIETLNPIYE